MQKFIGSHNFDVACLCEFVWNMPEILSKGI